MTPLIQTSEDQTRLREIAASWIGTPWIAQGMVKGSGVSCTGLPYAILAEFGHGAPLPPSRMEIFKRDILPTCKDWLTRNALFYEPVLIPEITAGDVLLFDCGIGHMALCLGGLEIIHSWQTTGAHLSSYSDPRLAMRIHGAWRPIS